jgi:hypothetical protein
MINTKKMVKDRDYGCFLIALLSNSNIHPLINEEYNKNRMKYDELILKHKLSQEDYCKRVPEDIIDLGLKLTGIFLSSCGNEFLIKILKSGWPNLYNYIKTSKEIIYEEIKEINDYGLDRLDEDYSIIIIKVISDIFNKKLGYINDNSKEEIERYNKRLGFAGGINKKQICEELEKDFQLASQNVKYTEMLTPQVNAIINNHLLRGITFLFYFYSIDLTDFVQYYDIIESDKELIAAYLLATKTALPDIINNDLKREEMANFIIISRFFQNLMEKYRALHKKYLKFYEKSIKTDIEFEKLKEDNLYLKEQIEKLECENKQLKEKLKIVSLDTIREKEKEIINIKKQYDEIIKEKDKLIEENKEEIQLLKMTIENLIDESRYVNEEQITNDALTGTRGVIIGGTPQWQQHMRKIVPHFKFIEVEQLNYDTKILENADKIYFNTAYNSHAMFYKTINAVRKNKIEIVFINNNSITAGFKMFGQKNGQYKGEHLVS